MEWGYGADRYPASNHSWIGKWALKCYRTCAVKTFMLSKHLKWWAFDYRRRLFGQCWLWDAGVRDSNGVRYRVCRICRSLSKLRRWQRLSRIVLVQLLGVKDLVVCLCAALKALIRVWLICSQWQSFRGASFLGNVNTNVAC